MNNSNSDYRKFLEQYLEQEQFNQDQFFKFYELQNRIVHPDTDVPGGGEQHIIDKNLRECRFCSRTKADGASFKKKAHIFPEQLGNKLVISHSECDDCNKFFANHESNLGNFLGPLKTLLGVKGKSKQGSRIPKHKVSITGTKITHTGQRILWEQDIENSLIRLDSPTEISFGVKHRPFIPISVWKGLARTAVHLIDLNELDNFIWFKECVSTDKHDNILKASQGLCTIFSIFIPSAFNIYPRPELRLFKRKEPGLFEVKKMVTPEKMYVFSTSSHVYQIPIFSDKDYEDLNDPKVAGGNRSIPFYPLNIDEEYIEGYDLPKRNVHNLNSVIQETPLNWVQFSYNNIEPITTERLTQNGFSDDEIKCLKSNKKDSPETLKKFSKLINNS